MEGNNRMLNEFLTKLNDIMYSYILIFLLVGIGIYFSCCTRGVQFRLLKDGLKSLLVQTDKEEGKRKISSFEALMISTASRVGTGNIAGVATAIAAGGPGTVFWMWITAIIGGASAFIESTLAQVYKVKGEEGTFRGGPSYYMERGLKKRWMGVLFSVLLIICFGYGFNGLQTFNISSALEYYIPNYRNTSWPMVTGLLLAVATGLVIWGGVHRIGIISSVLVPIMAVAYIGIGYVSLLMNIKQLPGIIKMILESAFNIRAIAGGMLGTTIITGVKRGLFSNEAGMGSAPNASASADVDHPVKQGLVQMISVYIDTILVSTSTAMILFSSGIVGESGRLDGIPYVQAAIRENVGDWGIHFITISIFAFAFSSLIGNYYYAESNLLFMSNNNTLLQVFRMTCVFAVFLGAQVDFDLIWNFADVTMGLMAIVNIIAIFMLRKQAYQVLEHYDKEKAQGKNPVFFEEEVRLKDTVWTK